MVENEKQNPDRSNADNIADGDAHKVEKLTNAGEDIGAVEEAEKI